MDPNRTTDRILDEWDAVASTARPPKAAPRRRASMAGLASGLGLAGAGVLAAGLVVGVIWLGGRITPGVGASGSPAPSTAPSPDPGSSPLTAESVAPGLPATCASAQAAGTLDARITAWEGAAGSRIATVTIKNTGTAGCRIGSSPSAQLVDAHGRILVAGPDGPRTASAGLVAPGASFTTLVEISNVCGAEPAFPLHLTFVEDAPETIVAAPLSATDTTVPPCNGPTVPATLQTQPWTAR